ncbi:MAG: PD-(D/E)XK nuclease family protein [bacterium]|nr:PD-(D/E)XK nuclease family protein [bacterium]
MKKINLNGSDISFPQDSLLDFEEESHTYTVQGVGEMTSVSTVIKKFFNEFDALKVSLRKCDNNHAKAKRLREEWDAKGAEASLAGTHLHKEIEESINGKTVPELSCKVEYSGEYVQVQKVVSIAKEWSHYQKFRSQRSIVPFRTEWSIYDTDARIAGTIDLLAAEPDGTYKIYDWKRSNKIDPNPKKFWNYGKNGLERLPDTTYYHYCLQQNLYRYILQKNYGLKVSEMNLVVLHYDYNNPIVLPVPLLQYEVQKIIEYVTKEQQL